MSTASRQKGELRFRDIYEHVVLVKKNMSDEVKGEASVPVNADSVLAYGYVSPDAGLSFAALAPASFEDEKVFGVLSLQSQGVSLNWAYADLDFDTAVKFLPNEKELLSFFADDIAAIKSANAVDPGREMTRTMASLDDLRDKTFPDNVSVVFGAEERNAEEVWFQLLGVTPDPYLVGMMVSEPEQDFGVHQGQTMILLPDETANRPRLLTSPDCLVILQ